MWAYLVVHLNVVSAYNTMWEERVYTKSNTDDRLDRRLNKKKVVISKVGSK